MQFSEKKMTTDHRIVLLLRCLIFRRWEERQLAINIFVGTRLNAQSKYENVKFPFSFWSRYGV